MFLLSILMLFPFVIWVKSLIVLISIYSTSSIMTMLTITIDDSDPFCLDWSLWMIFTNKYDIHTAVGTVFTILSIANDCIDGLNNDDDNEDNDDNDDDDNADFDTCLINFILNRV